MSGYWRSTHSCAFCNGATRPEDERCVCLHACDAAVCLYAPDGEEFEMPPVPKFA